MSVPGFGQVVIDLAGLDISRRVTILDAHGNNLNAVLGSGKAEVVKGQLEVIAQLADTDAAASVLELLDVGVALQASVGVRPGEISDLRPGNKLEANGRKFEIDRHTSFIKTGILEEVSILPMGADGDTEVSLAARRANGGKMESEITTEAPDLVQAERDRVLEITSALREHPEICATAIRDNWSPERANREALERLRASRPTLSGIVNGRSSSDVPARSVIASAVLLRAGRSDVALKAYGDRAVNAASELRCNSLFDICRASLRLAGHDDWNSGDRDQVIKASFSTMSLPVGLGDAINKMSLQQYQQASGTWRLFAKIAPLNDFHSHPFIRPHFAGASMKQLAPNGEIRHTSLSEEVFTVSADTFAEMLTVDRRAIINDSTGLIVQFADALARKAASTVSDLVWQAILGNANSHFGSGNANLTDAVLSIDGLSAAITKMRKQADASGKPIDIAPRVLVVPPELEGLARQIIRSTEVLGDGTSSGQFGVGTGSPLPDDLVLGVEPRISSSAFTGNSETGWFLFAGPMDSPVVVGFLGGQDSPTVETVEPPSNTLGMTMRGYIDCGVALGDHRAAVMSSGDAVEPG